MGDGEDSKKKNIVRTTEMENLSLDISANSRLSRDLLQRFMGTASEYEEAVKEEEDEEIELNLGLSLGGRFGVDKSSQKLVRSSSVASCLPVVRDDNDFVAPAPVVYSGLARTSSLPVETEEEWRKRKELQTLRRMEAKRRRSEKQRNLRNDKEGGGNAGGTLSLEERKEIEVNLRERLDREKSLSKRAGSSLRSQFGLSSWAAAAASQAILRSGIDAALAKGKGSYVGSSGGIQGLGQPASQGSVESKGGSSSSVSDLESKTLQGISVKNLLTWINLIACIRLLNFMAGLSEMNVKCCLDQFLSFYIQSYLLRIFAFFGSTIMIMPSIRIIYVV
ncbi:UNVERIFIED_CONTAM: Ninja-family protein AFP2 [Sesamum indicum]